MFITRVVHPRVRRSLAALGALALTAALLVVSASPAAAADTRPRYNAATDKISDPLGAGETSAPAVADRCYGDDGTDARAVDQITGHFDDQNDLTQLDLECRQYNDPAPTIAYGQSVRIASINGGAAAGDAGLGSTCPEGDVVVGVGASTQALDDGGDALVDLRTYCSPLDNTGRTYGTPVDNGFMTGAPGDNEVPNPPELCPSGSYVIGLRGYAGGILTGVQLECDAPTFDADGIAANFPHTSTATTTLSAVGYPTGQDTTASTGCGDGALGTGAASIDQHFDFGSSVGALGVDCQQVRADGALEGNPVTATAPDLSGSDYPRNDIDGSCDSGVLTGLGLYGRPDQQTISGAVPYCSNLGADGSVLGSPMPGDHAVGATNTTALTPALCPTGTAVVGVAVASRPDDVDYRQVSTVTLTCSSLVYGAVTPQPANSSWTTATLLGANDSANQALTSPGGALWYRFPVQPSSQVQVTLSGLAVNDDLAVFSDIGEAFTSLENTHDLTKLSADFAGVDFAPTTFSPTTFSPTTFSPTTFSPTTFSPTTFSPTTFSPTTFSPTTFSPTTFSPTTFSPTTFSPTTFSPSVTPDEYFRAGAFADEAALAGAFSAAQTRSLLGVSAQDGTTTESVSLPTYNDTGYFYVRVTGRNAAVSPQPLTVTVATTGGPCARPLNAYAGDQTLVGTPGSARSVVLTDSGRLTGSAADVAALASANRSFGGAVGGAVVDLARSPKVQDLQAQADAIPGCPYAKNLVAQAIRDIVNSYRDTSGTLNYVVIEGDDSVIPFFRYADTAGVAAESGYVPPVADASASNASLRNDLVLGQDAYGSTTDVTVAGTTLPVPDLAVGRLVSTPAQITATLQAYLAKNQAAITPGSTLATGYDFLAAGAKQVAASFAAADAGGRNDTLITNQGVPRTTTTANGKPSPTTTWTATDLKNALLGARHDVVYLAGHFSANAALAADFATTITTDDIAAAPASTFANTLVFSAGCHSGYNIVAGDGISGVTDDLDWAQALTSKGATLVAGTGYQYGDTDFVRYSNDLYSRFASALRTGTGAVAVGTALEQTKHDYLTAQASLDGVDVKSVEEATLFGLPMQGVNFPSGRTAAPAASTPVTTTPAAGDPGATLGLSSAQVTVSPKLTSHATSLASTSGGTVAASYLSGAGGVEVTPAAPTLPLVAQNATAPAGTVLRGVGFRSGTYTDTSGVTPVTGAPATETNTVHGPFVSDVFYPDRLATPNYFDALGGSGSSGGTNLLITPTQYRSDAPGSATDVQRTYSALGFALYYSGNVATYGANLPADASAPSFSGVTATPSADGTHVTFAGHVVGDPSAGVQSVWVTWTDPKAPGSTKSWRSIDLVQDAKDSTLWRATLTLPTGQAASDVKFLVQAVNGVGVVGADDDLGAYYPVTDPSAAAPAATTTLTLSGVPSSVPVGGSVPVRAHLADASGQALAGRPVTFSADGSGVVATTNSAGDATATLPIAAPAGGTEVSVSYGGAAGYISSTASPAVLTVIKRSTSTTTSYRPGAIAITLRDTTGDAAAAVSGIPNRTVFAVATDDRGTVLSAQPFTTGATGVALVPTSSLPAAATGLTGWFGRFPLVGASGQVDTPDPVYAAGSGTSISLRPASLGLTPASPSTTAGTPVTFTATGYQANHDLLRDETDASTFTITPNSGGASASGASCAGAVCVASAAGSYTVKAVDGAVSATAPLTVTAAAPATVSATAGSVQTAAPGAAFGTPLSARVTDAYGNPVAGAPVAFTVAAPTANSGTATFAGGKTTATVAANASGVATAPTLTAGNTAGPVVLTATTGAAAPAEYQLAVAAAGPAKADLTVTVSAPGTATAGDTVSVIVTVTNKGPDPASRVGTVAAVGSPDSIVRATGGTLIGRQFALFTAPSLASGASMTYPVTVAIGSRTGTRLVAAGVLSATADPDRRSNVSLASVRVR